MMWIDFTNTGLERRAGFRVEAEQTPFQDITTVTGCAPFFGRGTMTSWSNIASLQSPTSLILGMTRKTTAAVPR